MLDDILAHKRREVAEAKERTPLPELKKKAERGPGGFFAGAIRSVDGIKLIAEIKKASPSKGLLSADFDPARLADVYACGGASALSVLTDRKYFQGDPSYLRIAKRVSRLPVLRKDFVIDEYQLWESLVIGGDAVLLIVAALDRKSLRNFVALSSELGLDALVEAHDAEQLDAALEAKAGIIGINNRDLRTFETRLATTLELAPRVPDGIILVSESGISTAGDVRMLRDAGVDAILVGEALVTSPDIQRKMRELLDG
ncbi:MAG: indole-3-glycerol phosphate synthase TrpC [Candidatus Abyssobacteria bacterium SURF_5]|uniref:Indole-3-glycerol phosphate synthase n=1 Tax=Abyssobacteria bacterium (strain SURF_5) TaxID=2093360 RepID=A0A3A4PAX6_ABYX5|nr:MAG: indole-3-glycerol phosphate synthase TrpC [Candidatus Abyssubacteria bacterium SURF_5]